jgi:small subunit ribosomal protein S21
MSIPTMLIFPISASRFRKEQSEKDMIEIEVRYNDIEQAIHIFKKKVEQAGILRELRERSAFMKPSERKKRKMWEAIRRSRKKQRRENQ